MPDVIASHESQASVQPTNAQIDTSTTNATQEFTTKHTQERVDVHAVNGLTNGKTRKRTTSFTHSEKEAVGTLDQILKDFDFDDNLNEVVETDGSKTGLESVSAFVDESPYASIMELKENELPKNDAENKLKPIVQPEPIYAKPIKPKSPSKKGEIDMNSILNPYGKNKPADESPVVPPKLFETKEYEIKFSDLKSTPSMSLSHSLKETDWANANVDKSITKRRPGPTADSNNNYSLQRGKLSKPNESTEDYVKPTPDYDVNGTMSSTGKSTNISDDSFTRDNWTGSFSSSSGSGNRKEPKPIRPEVLELMRKKKISEQADARDGPQHDGLVKRSFRLIRESSLKEDRGSETSGSDYVAVKNEADKWLANNERLRANSQGKKYDSTGVTNSSASDSPQRKVLGAENGSSNAKNESLKTDIEPSKSDKSGSVKSESGSLKSEFSSDDENLVRLMETGIFPESTSRMVNGSQNQGMSYVPRALRMSFGSSWDGVRKDRRAWKSREINAVTSQNARKGSQKLSNRLDEQNQQLEMLF